jgi:hypothetical protein
MTMHRTAAVAVVFGLGLAVGLARADEPKPISLDKFDALHKLIKPATGESRWMEIDWYPSVQEARKKAAKEGKPLFIWAGSGGAPAAGC